MCWHNDNCGFWLNGMWFQLISHVHAILLDFMEKYWAQFWQKIWVMIGQILGKINAFSSFKIDLIELCGWDNVCGLILANSPQLFMVTLCFLSNFWIDFGQIWLNFGLPMTLANHPWYPLHSYSCVCKFDGFYANFWTQFWERNEVVWDQNMDIFGIL